MMLKRRKYAVSVRGGNLWISGISLAIICHVFFEDQMTFRDSYRNMLNRLLSDV
jgi:hypothetical protein